MKPSLALSMIVKNGGGDLAKCLESVRGIVDEIVVADTGSTDDSVAIAKSFGARVIQIPWQDDFAAARNASLREVRADWVLVLDADEQLDEGAGAIIAAALQQPGLVGCGVTIRNYVRGLDQVLWDRAALPNDGLLRRADPFPAYLEHPNVRLFRNHPEIYFERRVHETVGDRARAVGALVNSGLIIHHFGFVAGPEEKARKNQFYFELGQRKLREMPDNAQAYLEVGLMELDCYHRYDEAERLFARACELAPSMASAWVFRGKALLRLNREKEALPCLQQARQLGGINTAGCLEAEGDAFYGCKQFAEARRAYRKSFKLRQSTNVLSKLGLTELRQGHADSGLKKLNQAVATPGAMTEHHDRLISGLASLGRIAEAASATEEKLKALGSSAKAYLRAGVLWARAQNSERAFQIVSQGIKEFPDSAELHAVSAELLKVHAGQFDPGNIPEQLKVQSTAPDRL
jgi:glycosyltransferase involved in cell wall biosynthesis